MSFPYPLHFASFEISVMRVLYFVSSCLEGVKLEEFGV